MDPLEQHWPMVCSIAEAMARKMRGYWRAEELASFGFDGLRSALRCYDPSRGPWKPYARLRIKGAILDGISDHRWHFSPPSSPGMLRSLVDPIKDRVADQDEARAILRRVAPRVRRCLTEYYIHGLDLRTIGRRLGVTESAIGHALARARRRLQQELRA